MASRSLVLPPALGSYVALFSPRAGMPQADGTPGPARYNIVLLYPKGSETNVKLQPLMKMATEVAESKWPTKGAFVISKMRWPLIADGDDRYPDDPAFKDRVFVRASTIADPNRRPPGVVDTRGNVLISDEDAYSGCIFRVQVNLFPFDKAGNKGVGLGLQNIQVVEKGERLDGRMAAGDAFKDYINPEEGGDLL